MVTKPLEARIKPQKEVLMPRAKHKVEVIRVEEDRQRMAPGLVGIMKGLTEEIATLQKQLRRDGRTIWHITASAQFQEEDCGAWGHFIGQAIVTHVKDP
jgi:hypothetical protein